jgi:hypothetical protein
MTDDSDLALCQYARGGAEGLDPVTDRAAETQVAVVHVCLVGNPHNAAVGSATGRSTVYMPCDDVVWQTGTPLTLARDEAAATVRPYGDTEEFE